MTGAESQTVKPPLTRSTIAPGDANHVSEPTLDSGEWRLELRDWTYDPDFFDALRSLAASATSPNPFFDADFLNASDKRTGDVARRVVVLWEHFAEEATMRLAFPVAEETVGFPGRSVWRAQSMPYAPLGMPLIHATDAGETLNRFCALYPRLSGLGHKPLVFEDFPYEFPAARDFVDALVRSGLETVCQGHVRRAALNAAGQPSLSAKRRQELRRQMRRLGELGSVRLDDAMDFWSVMTRFEEFLALETRGWKGRRGTSFHILRKTAAFARQTVAALADRGRASIHSLRLDDRAIATLIVLRAGGHYYPWKTAFDEAYASYSPGKQLMAHTTEWLMAQPGFEHADSLAAEHSWMERLWPDTMGLCRLVVAGDPSVDAAGVARAMTRRDWARNNAKRWLARR